MCLCHGGPKGGAKPSKNRAPKGGGPKGGEAKISRFFFPLLLPFSLLLSLSGCLLVEFWWCLKRRGPQMCAFGVGLSCEAPAALNPPAHTFQGPGLQKHHQNSTRRHPERDRKSDNGSGRGKKKGRNRGLPTLRGPALRGPTVWGPTLRGPIFSGFEPHPWAPP